MPEPGQVLVELGQAPVNRRAAPLDVTALRRGQACEDPHERRLAATVGAHEVHDVAGRDLERQALDQAPLATKHGEVMRGKQRGFEVGSGIT